MNLSAEILTTYQRCKRKRALEMAYRPVRWHPKTLFESVLRPAIGQLSNGADVIITRETACNRLMEEAAHSGLDTLKDPYTLAKDYCAIIGNLIEALYRMSLLVVKPGRVVPLGDTEHCWKISAFEDESGTLHRWVFVDKWDDDAMYRELHSWHCFGDCAAAQAEMTLHVIEIGQNRNGHQHCDWARAYKHPAIINKFRFRKVDGTRLESSWTPMWFQNSAANDPKVWVDLMEADKLDMFRHIPIKAPSDVHVKDFHKQVNAEVLGMMEMGKWSTVPMSRPACDMPYICPWQEVCFNPNPLVDVVSIGPYNAL